MRRVLYIKEHWASCIPFISWVTRPYHWIKKDEDTWEGIDRNIDAIAGNVILFGIAVTIRIILMIVL